jgi:hypothetical protein
MSDQDYRDQEFQDLGFRCVRPTSAILIDGTHVTIKADSYRRSHEKPDDTPHRQRALRFYRITEDGSSSQEVIDELTLEERLGTEVFNRLGA